MAGYKVTVKHSGKHYEIPVSDAEISVKLLEFRRDCPQLSEQVTIDDIAEMVAHEKIPYAVELNQNSRQSWRHGIKCSLCNAGHRMVTTVLNHGTFANIQNEQDLYFPKIYVCEKCFETEFTTCKKCGRDLMNHEVENDICSLCSGSQAPLNAKRISVN